MIITHKDERYRTNIRDYLVHRAHAVRVDAKGNLMNLSILSEDFYAKFLNILFDLHLKNANADEPNAKGIDLIDLENHVAVQVSLTCAPKTIRKKIRESMRKYDKPNDEVWQFYFVPITDKAPELKKGFSLPEGLIFDKDHDVLDISRLLTLALDRHKLRPLSQLVDKYSKKDSIYQELRNSLDRLLLETWKNHRSFKLMHTDEIDRRLFPEIKDSQQFEALGRRKEGETESPVWSIIRDSWKEPENYPVMIDGKCGIGKTVTLFSVTDMDKNILPAPAVYVPMFELIGKNGEIINLTEFFHSCEPFSSLSEEQRNGICSLASQPWDHGPSLLVLLDGFNEVPGDCRWEVLKMLQNWHRVNTGAQLIAVSRPMDNLNLENAFGNNTISITLSELKRESVADYLKNLNEENLRLPEPESSAWDTIIYPLFLTLYIKSERLREQHLWKDYPLLIRNITGPGTLIWNYLQRELLRQENEGWILRCALVCEYIMPELAYHMLRNYDYTISQSEAVSIIHNTVSEMDWGHLPKHLNDLFSWWKWQNLSTDPLYFLKDTNWPDFSLREIGLLTPYRESKEGPLYEFFHQSFRDCLAGIYLVNQAETAKGNVLPVTWKQAQNHLALDYAAELMDEDTADRLWKINRSAQQYGFPGYVRDPSSTFTLLELQKRRKPMPKDLDFSGMDLRGVSLARYMAGGKNSLPLFHDSHLSYGTNLDCSTFQNEGHHSTVSCILVLPDSRVVSGSDDHSLRVWDPSTAQCMQTLKEHFDRVSCVAVLPNGRIISGSDDHSLRVWDPSTGFCLQTLEGHSGCVSCAAVLPGGRIVSGSDDSSLRVWDPSTGLCLQTLEGHSGCVGCVAVLPDGRVVSGSDDHSLRVWDPSTGLCLQTLEGHSGCVSCAAVLPGGCIVSGSDDSSLRVWDPSTGLCLQTLEGHSGCVSYVAVLPDGRVVSGSDDSSLRVWDSSTGLCLQTLEGHSGRVSCVAVLPGSCVVSGSYDHSLRVWDPSTGLCLQTLEGHPGWVTSVAVLPGGRVVSGSSDSSLRVWDPSTGLCLQVLGGHPGWVDCVSTLPNGRIVCSSGDSFLRVWDPSTGKFPQTLKGHSGWIDCVAVLPDGHVVSGSDDHSLRVWDPSTGLCLQVLEGHSSWVDCVAVLPDDRVVSGSGDSSLRVWDPSTGLCLQVLEGHSGRVSCVVLMSDSRIVSGSSDSTLRVWDPSTGLCLQTLEGHSDPIRCVTVLSDGLVVSGSDDYSLRVWDPSTGFCLQTLKGHSNWVTCVAVLPGGRIVSGSSDSSLRVWDPSTGLCLQVLEGHSDWVTCVAVLPGGRIVSGSSDSSLRVWDPSTGLCLQTLEGHSGKIDCVMVLPGGHIVSSSQDNTIKIWDTTTWKCMETILLTEINVSGMDLSNAKLTKDLAKMLWQNNVTIPADELKDISFLL